MEFKYSRYFLLSYSHDQSYEIIENQAVSIWLPVAKMTILEDGNHYLHYLPVPLSATTATSNIDSFWSQGNVTVVAAQRRREIHHIYQKCKGRLEKWW